MSLDVADDISEKGLIAANNGAPVEIPFLEFQKLFEWARSAALQNVSDVLIYAGMEPRVRTLNGMARLGEVDARVPAATVNAFRDFALRNAPEGQGERLLKLYNDTGRASVWYPRKKLNMRFSFFSGMKGPCVAVRLVYKQFCQLDNLKLARLKGVLQKNPPCGLILLTSGAGGGRTTTAQACLNYINSNMPWHVVDVSPSDEWIYEESDQNGKMGYVVRIRVGSEARTTQDGLKIAKDMGAHVLFLGDLSSPEDFMTAVRGVASGLMVIGVCHAGSVADGLNLFFSAIPESYSDYARGVLSCSRVSVLNQKVVRFFDSTPKLIYELLYAEPVLLRENGGASSILNGYRNLDSRSVEKAITESAGSMGWDRCIVELELPYKDAHNYVRDIACLSSPKRFPVPVRS